MNAVIIGYVVGEDSKKKLNKEQKKAVEHKGGPLLVIAGAGTGKTTVVTERVKHLISEGLAKPSEILALTFTDKAAREMEERVDVAMPYGYTQMWISTFHSFCDRVLRAEALHIGLDPKFKLMTQAGTIQFIRNNLFEFDLDYFRPRGNPTKFVGGMLQHFSRLQDENISPKEYHDWVEEQRTKNSKQQAKSKKEAKSRKKVRAPQGAKSSRDDSADLTSLSAESKLELQKWEEMAHAYKKYEELKVKDGMFDFGDLITKTITLFKDRPNILKDYQEKFKYILVDEFQDTNYAQNELAIMLAGKGKEASGPGGPQARRANITVTGDDDQSIYRFRGAAVSNILQFRDTYPKAKIVVLTKNYRSTQEILDKAYNLIKHNNPDRLESKEDIDKELVSQRKEAESEILFYHKDRVENEAEAAARKIVQLVEDDKYEYGDVAILVRANNHAETFIRAFQRNGVPYQFLGPGRLFRQPEVVDLVSYLKVLYDFEDSVALYRVLSIDYFDISSKDLIKISNYARRLNLSLFEALEKIDDIFVSDKTKEKITKILKVIKRHFNLVKKETAGQILYYFLEDTGLLQKLLNPDTADAEKKAANISKFFDKLKTYEVDHEDATVTAVVDWIDLSAELGESPLAADIDWTKLNAVNILTVHSAKGLEFPVVFLVNLVSRRFPTIERREQIPIPEEIIKEELPEGDYHEQEERRLFYVGMTRAKDRLYFTGANYYGEGKREKKLSPFIFEALGNDVVAAEEKEEGKQLSFQDYSAPQAEPKVQKPQLHVDYLSYSQIETFKTCPLHYKLKYILRIPTPPSPAQSFGISMHRALKEFYESVVVSEKPTEKLLLQKLDEEWIKEGYKSKSHEKKSIKSAKGYLKDYYEKEFDKKNLPVGLEKSFVVPLGSIGGKKKREHLKIGGKIDRVDKVDDGKLEIIDYKTGANIPTQKQIDHDMQLTFYALAATSVKEPPFVKKNGKTTKPEEVLLSLYYFDGQKRVTTKRTKEQLDEAVDEVYEWKEKIEKSDFKCSGHYFCKDCEYSLMCNAEDS